MIEVSKIILNEAGACESIGDLLDADLRAFGDGVCGTSRIMHPSGPTSDIETS
jgi:hypothetical protein